MKIWNVIFGCLCLIWVGAVYFVAEPEPVWDWRVAAAFAQALLSAGAIYSAWWLQDRKKRADRLEAEIDTRRAIKAITYLLEVDIAFIVRLAKGGHLSGPTAAVHSAQIEETDAILRRQNLSHLPTDRSVRAVLGLMQKSAQFAGALRMLYEGKIEAPKGKSVEALQDAYTVYFNYRSALLTEFGFQGEPQRKAIDDLKPWKPGDKVDLEFTD